jgi:hypothetical protein
MAARPILVSNRVNVPDAKGPRQAGGLTVAVNAALKQRANNAKACGSAGAAT